MALSAAVSVASFSVVLAQSFAAVAASSLVPATFLSLVRAAKAAQLAGNPIGPTSTSTAINSFLNDDTFSNALSEVASAVTDIDLLVPKTAKIRAEFEFAATDKVSANVGVSVPVQVVSISAGYSALYTSTSKNKVLLEVDFVSVNYVI